MSDVVQSLLSLHERRLSADFVDAISEWMNGESECGGSVSPGGLFQRYIIQLSGRALGRANLEDLRLATKANLRTAHWIPDSYREHDWHQLSFTMWVCRQLGVDSRQFLLSVAGEFSETVVEAMEDILPSVAHSIERYGGPSDSAKRRYVAVVAGDDVDFEPVWSLDGHQNEVHRVVARLSMLDGGVAKVRQRDGEAAAVEFRLRVEQPERGPMDWFGGDPAPHGMEIWEDEDRLDPASRAVMDHAAGSFEEVGGDEAAMYVREKAGAFARTGDEIDLRRALVVASMAADHLLGLPFRAASIRRADGGVEQVLALARGLDAGVRERVELWSRRPDAVTNLGGCVETGLFTGLKFAERWEPEAGPSSGIVERGGRQG